MDVGCVVSMMGGVGVVGGDVSYSGGVGSSSSGGVVRIGGGDGKMEERGDVMVGGGRSEGVGMSGGSLVMSGRERGQWEEMWMYLVVREVMVGVVRFD